jgi:hypothetical protein
MVFTADPIAQDVCKPESGATYGLCKEQTMIYDIKDIG